MNDPMDRSQQPPIGSGGGLLNSRLRTEALKREEDDYSDLIPIPPEPEWEPHEATRRRFNPADQSID